jgi:phosphoribosylamine---glycine ligase
MKYLFVSLDGLIADIAWAVVKEGHDVKFYINDPYELEDDRAFGQQELKNAGVSIIPQENFTSFDDAIKFVESNPGRYVIKPSGEAQNYKRLLFVGEEEDGHDVLQVLGDYKTAMAHRIKEFQLQRRIMGVEVAAGAFFNGKDFIYPICVNFEHKKLFPGDIGPSTGEMGTSMFWSEPNKIFNATLRTMAPKLREEGYVGGRGRSGRRPTLASL